MGNKTETGLGNKPETRHGSGPQLLSHDYSHDANGNVTAIEDLLNSPKNKTFGYDALDRLTSATGPWPSSGSLSYTYDSVGNRLTEGGSLGSSTYTYSDNLLTEVTGAKDLTFSYDASGNTVAENNRVFIYNQDNRLVQVTQGGNTLGTYIYDGQGRRVKKVSSGQTTYFLYDQQYRLIAEADGSGDVITEYLYLPGRPLVKIDIDGSNETVLYYHTDHLGTPLFLTDSAGETVWSAELLPFGEGYDINEDVDGDQENVINNMRFPGQYYDIETELYYNMMRDYHSLTGRYMESDPIGMEGGLNVYTYTFNNPLRWSDVEGLKVRFKSGVTTAFKNQLSQAIQYLKKGGASGIFDKLEELPQTVWIDQADAGSNDMYYDPNTKTIVWDPLSALRFECCSIQTPALGLLHEGGHALGDLTGTLASTVQIPGDPYDTAEEKRVIINIETPAAIKLGEGVRTGHGGIPYQVPCPSCR